jgi:hypothetical protein
LWGDCKENGLNIFLPKFIIKKRLNHAKAKGRKAGSWSKANRKEVNTMKRYVLMLLLIGLLGTGALGCCGLFWGGAAVGAVGAGAAYEINNKYQMDQLEQDYRKGNITQKEYEARKKQIKEGSVFY